MSDLLMIVPSRGRPGNIAELAGAWRDTACADSQLLVAVDDDDPHREAYADAVASTRAASLVVGPRLRLGGTLNHLAVAHARSHRAIGFMGDDHRPRTVGWDQRLVDELGALGAVGLVYGNDLIQGERLPTAVAMTSSIVTTLGYMAPPGMVHMYLDNFWLALGRELGRIRYLPDVVIQHLHPVAGTAAWDTGYAEVNTPERYAADRAVFERWLAESMPVETARLKALVA